MTEPPPSAALEIERKFLVDRLPDEVRAAPSTTVRQGYVALHDDGVEVRVRREGDTTTLTIKSGPANVRVEEEMPIDERRFAALWALTDGRRVAKTRRRIADGDVTIEVDVYEDALAGLVTAEIEFPSAEASARWTPPAWLGTEVTSDARYANQSLATRGLPA